MDINIGQIKNYFSTAYQNGSEWVGVLAERTIKLFNPVINHIQQDERAAVALFASANILFFETALLVAKLADKFFNLFGSQKEISKIALHMRFICTLGIVTTWIIGCNIALVRAVKPNLAPNMIGLISTGSCVSYIAFRLFCAAMQESKSIG